MISIYENARIYTGSLPLVTAMAVKGSRILCTGSNDFVKAEAGKLSDEIEIRDMQGAFLCPGFNDSHMHLINHGHMLHAIPLQDHSTSLEELIRASREFLRLNPVAEGEFLIGRGFNQDYFTDKKRIPDRHDLDRITRETPMVAIRCCGHCLVANTKALEVCGLFGPVYGQPQGGRIGLEEKPEYAAIHRKTREFDPENYIPDGRFFDTAMDLILDQIPAPDKKAIKGYIMKAEAMMNSYGITSCHSDDYSAFCHVKPELINEAYRELEKEGLLSVRVYEQCNIPDVEAFADFMEAGNLTEHGGKDASEKFFRIGPLKLLGDGSLGARTAYLKSPYMDDQTTCGFPLFTQDFFDNMIGLAHKKGTSVAVHCIGDACLDMVLHALKKVQENDPVTCKELRHGIVHCQITRKDQLETIASLGLHVYAQTIFLDYDNHIVYDRVGPELAKTSYNFKTLKELGATVSNGSDCPVELHDVMKGIECAVTRCSVNDHLGPFLNEEAMSVREAIDSFTKWSAYASFDEGEKGELKEGMLADFIVLSGNPFETDPFSLHKIRAMETYVGGKCVFKRNDTNQTTIHQGNESNYGSA